MTNLVRFSPTSELRRMQREIDRLFDDVFPARAENGEGTAAVWSPRADVSETEDAYMLHIDAPGLKKDDFNISWQDGVLTVSGDRKWEDKEQRENYVRIERSFGHFFRSFTLPNTVKSDEISGSYDDGVLTLRVPKAEESKPRRIEIK